MLIFEYGLWISLFVVVTLGYFDCLWQATVLFIASVFLVGYLAPIALATVIMFFYQHSILLICSVPVYLLVGMIFGNMRWNLFVRSKKNYINELTEEFKDKYENKLGTMTLEKQKEFWLSYIEDHNMQDYLTAPKVFKHKTLILKWMMYWPISLLTYLLSDPIRNMFKYILQITTKRMQNTSNNIYKDIKTF
jgi:hypothetical protein